MRKGTVTWVDSENKFGFIGITDSKGVHFHRDFQVEPKNNDQEKLIFIPVNKKTKNVRRIKVGDVLLYEIEQKAKGPVASLWLFDDDNYQEALLRQEKYNPIYRVIRQSAGKTEEIWRGSLITDFFEKNLMKDTCPSIFRSIFNKPAYQYRLEVLHKKEWKKYENQNKSII